MESITPKLLSESDFNLEQKILSALEEKKNRFGYAKVYLREIYLGDKSLAMSLKRVADKLMSEGKLVRKYDTTGYHYVEIGTKRGKK